MHEKTPNLDPSAPLVVDTRKLPRSPGAHQELRLTVPALDGLGPGLIGVPDDAELLLELSLTSVTEGVLASGTVTAPVIGECGRCLRPIEDTLVVDVQELYAYPDSATDETTEEDEVMRLQDDLIDLEPPVRDAVVLGLPSNPLCRPDCPGLCPDCGRAWDELPADHRHETLDPRWAELSKLLDQDRSE
ncbi:metal-binding protein [Actinorhabdospora filicis]|uniref:Metal-binding protein n=1 Tax=Actinorhabdospora filicis TaxID=1785913 RepID=A0A9W6WCM0_9ACTN|nr:YceD family protein [Actinorhabdospora filicis]GLZ79925.1 metal-binding protein [Actinorhabdospora filicis]